MRVRYIALTLILTAALTQTASAYSLFFYGNSLTDGIHWFGLWRTLLAADNGNTLDKLGNDILLGSTLHLHLANASSGYNNMTEFPVGTFNNAMSNHGPWDGLSLQPFSSNIIAEAAAAKTLITSAQQKNPNIQPFILATWAWKCGDRIAPSLCNNYSALWKTPFLQSSADRLTTTVNQPCTEDYWRQVFELWRKEITSGKPVLMIPVGHVFYELDVLIKAGKVPGISDIFSVYTDDIHPMQYTAGNYAAAMTYYAVIFGESPVGLPCDTVTRNLYSKTPGSAARIIQETAWKVVTSMSAYTGVSGGAVSTAAPDPSKMRTVEKVMRSTLNSSQGSGTTGTYLLNGTRSSSAKTPVSAGMVVRPTR